MARSTAAPRVPSAAACGVPVRTSAGLDRDEIRRRKLLRAARRGDHGARVRLIQSHLPLVRGIASRYRDCGLPLDDLVQEGLIGLLDAIEHFDPGRAPTFEPYARFRVRRAMRNALTQQARAIRLPKQMVERRRALEGAEAQLAAAGERPTPADLAAATGLSVAAVLEARSVGSSPMSLDEPIGDGAALESLVADPAATDPAVETIEREQVELLERAIDRLPERQRLVVSAQWGLNGAPPATATDIARVLKLSPRRAQTIGRDALHNLRRELDVCELTP